MISPRARRVGNEYPAIVASRYGKIANLADFVRKAQLMNYEAFRAMYEGRNAQLFHPTTAIITWMSNPAQPSFVWQLYHYDLEPNSSLFAVRSAAEMVHIQFNEATGELQVINNLPDAFDGGTAHVTIYNLDGSVAYEHDSPVTAPAATAISLGPVQFPVTLFERSLHQGRAAGFDREAGFDQLLLACGAGASGRSRRI